MDLDAASRRLVACLTPFTSPGFYCWFVRSCASCYVFSLVGAFADARARVLRPWQGSRDVARTRKVDLVRARPHIHLTPSGGVAAVCARGGRKFLFWDLHSRMDGRMRDCIREWRRLQVLGSTVRGPAAGARGGRGALLPRVRALPRIRITPHRIYHICISVHWTDMHFPTLGRASGTHILSAPICIQDVRFPVRECSVDKHFPILAAVSACVPPIRIPPWAAHSPIRHMDILSACMQVRRVRARNRGAEPD